MFKFLYALTLSQKIFFTIRHNPKKKCFKKKASRGKKFAKLT